MPWLLEHPLHRPGHVLGAALALSRAGPLAAPQLLLSFYGMLVTYFVFPGVLEKLLGDDPLSPARIAERKAHLQRMVDVLLPVLREPPPQPSPRKGRSAKP